MVMFMCIPCCEQKCLSSNEATRHCYNSNASSTPSQEQAAFETPPELAVRTQNVDAIMKLLQELRGMKLSRSVLINKREKQEGMVLEEGCYHIALSRSLLCFVHRIHHIAS